MFNFFKQKLYQKKVQKYYNEELILLKKKSEGNNIYLIGTPEHSNIGDQAIALAELDILKECFYNYNIYEVSGYFYCAYKNEIQKIITAGDIILIHGGGFLGDLWLNEEEMARDILVRFPDNKVIILPQTIFFTTGVGSAEYEKSKQIYSQHRNLSIFVRDSNSYQLLKKMLPNNKIELTPDMVLLWKKQFEHHKKNNIALFCFRTDEERIISKQVIECIRKVVSRKEISIKDTSMIYEENYNKDVLIKKREEIVNNKFTEFSKAKIVITDRLHAMVMCAIVGTPCIVFDNVSKKVSCVYYDWLKEVPYIKVAEDMEIIHETINQILNNNEFKYNYDSFEYHREHFKHILSDMVLL